MKKIKVLQVGKYWDAKGGIETIFKLLCEKIKDKVDLSILHHSSNRHTIVIYNERSSIGSRGTLFSTPISPSFHNYFEDSDIIHIHLPNPSSTIAYLIKNPKGKLVVSYHSDIIRQKKLFLFYKPFLNKLLKKADAIIVASPAMKNSKVLKDFHEKCHVIPYGIDIRKIKKSESKRDGKDKVLFVGRLVYYKGVEYLIKAMENINAELIIVGEGPLKKKLMKLSSKPKFMGEVSDKELDELYNSCSLFVLPSVEKSEAFGIVQLEAMVRGKPVISTELGTGTSFVNVDGKTGFVVEPENVPELRNAIKKILKDKKVLKNMGIAAEKRVRNSFSLEKMKSATLRLYQKLLEK